MLGYTELVLGFRLKMRTPKVVIQTLEYMMGNRLTLDTVPDHPLFTKPYKRWRYMLRSYPHIFSGKPMSHIDLDPYIGWYNVSIRCQFENDQDEVRLFLDWILPYIVEETENKRLIGYTYKEKDEEPNLIYV